jgi:hypothetical protein
MQGLLSRETRARPRLRCERLPCVVRESVYSGQLSLALWLGNSGSPEFDSKTRKPLNMRNSRK